MSDSDGVLDLLTDFVCEYGPPNRTFGYSAPLTQELARTTVVSALRTEFYNQGGNAPLDGSGGQMNGLNFFQAKFIDALRNQKAITVSDFLGGLNKWNVRRSQYNGQDTVRFEVYNETTLGSGTRFGFSKPGTTDLSIEEYVASPSSYNGNGSNNIDPSQIAQRFNLITVLSNRIQSSRNSQTKTGLGGGTVSQTFTWQEPLLPCFQLGNIRVWVQTDQPKILYPAN